MARSLKLFAFFAIASLGLTASALAQYPVLSELYGRGVHAYNAGNTMEAHRYLSLAIDNGSRDPRAYYFRGIVNSATGRLYEAEADWRTGAELEANSEFGLTIGRSLSRIQGGVRMKLEGIRQQVRLEMRAKKSKRNASRYQELKAAESEVLRGGAPSAPPMAPPTAEVDDSSNPFADDVMDDAAPVPDSTGSPFGNGAPATDMAPAEDDLFGTPNAGAPAASPAGPDPFGEPAMESTEPAMTEPAPAGTTDPFGDTTDPFGSPEPSTDTTDPFGGDNPFGS